MAYAKKPKSPLTDIAIIDQNTIDLIVSNIPPSTGTYTHPTTHPATMIVVDESHRFVTDTEKTYWSGKQAALGFTPANENHTHEESGGLTQSQILTRQL